MVVVHLDELGQLLLLDLHVDVRVAVVVEDAEEPVDPHVDARGLEERRRRRDRSRSGPRRDRGKSSRRRGPRGDFRGYHLWTLVAIASDIDYRRAPPPPARAAQAPGPPAPPDRARPARRARRRRALRPRRRLVSGSAGAASVVLEPVRSAMPASPFRTPLPGGDPRRARDGAADEPAREASRSTSR